MKRNEECRRLAGGEVWLSGQEAKLLDLFASRQNRILSKELLASMLSKENGAIKPTSVEVSVHRLRKKTEHLGWQIETVRQIGYVAKQSAQE
ncbi:winged helix-turn-helix domain-containing protein [Achromobacter spanius]|uniref:winged helix-turn-helix domain-containing protein n=1 Tax=Achromobacter spanius TaxID=217203 RepID=UPI0038079968